MEFRSGKVIDRKVVKGDRLFSVTFRYPKPADAAEVAAFIEQILKEEKAVRFFKTVNENLQKKFMLSMIRKSRKKRQLFIVGEAEGKIMLVGALIRGSYKVDEHVADFVMAILPEYRHHGIGAAATELMLSMAPEIGIELVRSSYYEGNDSANIFYKKLGFRDVGRIHAGRKARKEYIDEIIVLKRLVK